MKTIPKLTLALCLLLAGCLPAQKKAPAFSASPVASAEVGECRVTAHSYAAQPLPTPIALVIQGMSPDELQLVWRDGSSLGSWQTGEARPFSVHVIGTAPEGSAALGLVILGSASSGGQALSLLRGATMTPLVQFSDPELATALVGIPTRPTIAYATLTAGPDGASLRSEIFLAEVEPAFQTRSLISTERSDGRYLLPVAIHRDVQEQADGLWYTTSLWGIGGDSLTDERAGLYYLDLAHGTSTEFLSEGCPFSALSPSQLYAGWSAQGIQHLSNLWTAEDVSFPRLAGRDRGPARGSLSSNDVLAWLEGSGHEFEGTLDTTLRIGNALGTDMGDFPASAFAGPSGLAGRISLQPLSWVILENEAVVVAVSSAELDRTVLLALDVNTGQIVRLAEGRLVGVAYP